MNATVFDMNKGAFHVAISELSQRLPKDGFFWLDIDGASVQELQSIAADLHLAEPVSSWLLRFGQRARLEAGRGQTRSQGWLGERRAGKLETLSTATTVIGSQETCAKSSRASGCSPAKPE